MPRLELSIFAKEDLDEIWLYIAVENLVAADRLVDELYERFGMLAGNPFAGNPRPEILGSLRHFPFKGYNIFYFPLDGGIEVLRVLHRARDAIQILGDDPEKQN